MTIQNHHSGSKAAWGRLHKDQGLGAADEGGEPFDETWDEPPLLPI
ncbi:MAG TPA: hypothetical protein VI796_05785 [Candidatus Thermoplasmatota archaeon]|nr:hypothetical protein [Candidatus Thermoplasmatota archaeon]